MTERRATAEWKGSLKEGEGKIALGSGAFEGSFSFNTRMGDEPGTNPEELIAGALAGCYAMALNATLEKKGTPARNVNVETKVHFGKYDAGFKISRIDLSAEASVEGIDDEAFQQIAKEVKQTCPVSKALAAIDITLEARLSNAASAA